MVSTCDMITVHKKAIACRTISTTATATLVPSCALPNARQKETKNPPVSRGTSAPLPLALGFFFRMTSRETCRNGAKESSDDAGREQARSEGMETWEWG